MDGIKVTLITVEVSRSRIPTPSRETRVNDVLVSSEQAGACVSGVKHANYLPITDLALESNIPYENWRLLNTAFYGEGPI
ncbi:hypothetical protein ASPFODRAFT_223753 [Aspergillus luchuensis CBS 106.47]|uniref:Uncharacterized protein n=1 Tax=Aspergillus luchuensis (strain CBS 106.47) TaxID=1137211 RepID=A0A1M3SZR2_ASPLC|nr:hypothetical protein ASPFODRAFT_223753 [Aspergillus luchuensis CBS 106.47]